MNNRTTKIGSLISAAMDEDDVITSERAARTIEGIVERFRNSDLDLISWKDITEKYQFCIYPSPYCLCDEHAKPSLFRRIVKWFRVK
jgi:hypothetical protein